MSENKIISQSFATIESRLESLHSQPLQGLTNKQLAFAGFYEEDKVITIACFSCGMRWHCPNPPSESDSDLSGMHREGCLWARLCRDAMKNLLFSEPSSAPHMQNAVADISPSYHSLSQLSPQADSNKNKPSSTASADQYIGETRQRFNKKAPSRGDTQTPISEVYEVNLLQDAQDKHPCLIFECNVACRVHKYQNWKRNRAINNEEDNEESDTNEVKWVEQAGKYRRLD